MSFRTIQQNTAEKTDTFSVPPREVANLARTPWFRNPTWPALPSITASDEKIVGLYAVYPNNSNFAAFNITVSTGTVRVDWGDGTAAQTYTSATQINYNYDYSAAGLANTDGPVTFTDAGDTVDRANHGYTNGQPISFASITTTTGISAGQIYYVVNAATNTFQLAATPGGSVLPLTNDGSGTILPYKIATITITPNTGGATITGINLFVRNTSTTIQYSTGWLDLSIAASCASLTIGGVISTITHYNLQQVRILRHRATSLSTLFQNIRNLQNVVEITAASGINVTNTSTMFSGCASLTSVPLFNTANVTDMSNMFNSCFQLITVPLFNTASVTSMVSMFSTCLSLTNVPLFNTASVNTMSSMFNSCRSLIGVPLFNTASATSIGSMFQGCYSLTNVPLFNTASVNTMASMFNGCQSLTNVPLFNTASVTNMSSMFQSCTSLPTIPLLNTGNVTNMNSMFQGCESLVTIPLLNTASVTSMNGTFASCSNLVTIPLLNTASVTIMSSMFSSCLSLITVPLLNTANVTAMDSMFFACNSLTSIPQFNTANVTNMTTMFSGAGNLRIIPAFNCQSVPLSTQSGFGSNLNSLSRIQVTNTYYSFSVANCLLSGSALDELYTNLPTVQPAATAVTFQGTPDTVTLNNHGYTNGRTVNFATITTTTGISINTNYFVRNVTTNTFQLSTTATGAIINLVNDGSGTLNGQTITVTGNWGTATDTPSIATAKGWAVTGS